MTENVIEYTALDITQKNRTQAWKFIVIAARLLVFGRAEFTLSGTVSASALKDMASAYDSSLRSV